MVTSFIIAILLFVVSSFLIGVTQALWLAGLFLGIAFLVIGILMVSNRSFREKYYRENMNDPEWERVHSEKEKKFLNRYYYPPKVIMAGIGLILLYYITHQHFFASIVNWLKK